jgi:predicted Zn-dependent protease with MMP-like domain
MTLELSKEDREAMIEKIITQTVERLVNECRDDLDLRSPAQVCGIIDVSAKTLADIKGLKRVTVVPNKIIRYRSSVLRQWIRENEG